MFKSLFVALIISLLTLSAYAQEDMSKAKGYELNPYDVGVKREINADVIKIEYTNVYISKDEAKIVGTVTVPVKYKVLQLTVDYYITDRSRTQSYVVILDLIKGAIPNTFTFEKHYPLDLTKYDFELLVIEFINEEVDTHSI